MPFNILYGFDVPVNRFLLLSLESNDLMICFTALTWPILTVFQNTNFVTKQCPVANLWHKQNQSKLEIVLRLVQCNMEQLQTIRAKSILIDVIKIKEILLKNNPIFLLRKTFAFTSHDNFRALKA